MAIITDSPRVIAVEGNPVLVRYVDLTKFLSMLDSKTIFFCRTDKLADPFEGTYSAPTRDEIIKGLAHMDRYMFNNPKPDLIRIAQQADSIIALAAKMKPFITVSCWQIFEQENALMWSAYTKGSEGIMIKTTYHELIKSLGNPEKEILISKVGYIEPNQSVNFGNTLYPFLYKRNFYQDEREVRCIYEVSNDYENPYPWDQETNVNGLYFPVDLNVLIKEVIVSPFSSPWFFELITSICKKMGLTKEIKKSLLS